MHEKFRRLLARKVWEIGDTKVQEIAGMKSSGYRWHEKFRKLVAQTHVRVKKFLDFVYILCKYCAFVMYTGYIANVHRVHISTNVLLNISPRSRFAAMYYVCICIICAFRARINY